MIEKIAEKNNLGYKQLVSNLAFNMIFKEGVNHPLSFVLTSWSPLFQIKLRALLSHIQQVRVGYWGVSMGKVQSLSAYGLPSPRSQDASDESQQPAEASGLGRSWVQSMFSRDRSIRANSFSRVRKWTDRNSLEFSLRTLTMEIIWFSRYIYCLLVISASTFLFTLLFFFS